MFQTLAYYATVFHRGFTAYTTQRLQKLGLNFGSLFPVIYVGKHPGCTQAELTAALGLDWGYSQRPEPQGARGLPGEPPGVFRLGPAGTGRPG